MTEVVRQLKEYVMMVGAEKLIHNPTPTELEAFEGLLFIRGIPNISLITKLAA